LLISEGLLIEFKSKDNFIARYRTAVDAIMSSPPKEEKRFRCEVCGEKFSRKGNLNCHKRKHSGEKPFVCLECGQRFSESGNLNKHKRRHTGERPYKCEECGKSFALNNSLKKHTYTHTGEKPFLCDECGKTFSQSGHLLRHKRSVHVGERPHDCNECEKKFLDLRDLSRHMKTHARKASEESRKVASVSQEISDVVCQAGSSKMVESSTSPCPVYWYDLYDHTLCTPISICTKLPEDFIFVPSVCSCANVAVVYGHSVDPRGDDHGTLTPVLMVEKFEMTLERLLWSSADSTSTLNLRARIDIAFGIVNAMEYFHCHLGVGHGYIKSATVLVTEDLTAKLLDPTAAFLSTDIYLIVQLLSAKT
jgi:DNA-directed RNA polymerase subunit RPC12/RpoP